jgi:hypothetical protein
MSTLLSGLPVHVADDETLARFITSSSYINSMGVKPAAFLPNPNNGETSVFRHGKTPEDSLWEIGEVEVASIGQRNIHGVAFIKTGDVRKESLDVESFEPPEKHADIKGWPVGSDLELQKAKQKEIALSLAENSELLRKP